MMVLLLLATAALPPQTQSTPATLGRGPFNGLKARVTAIRFFEGGGNIPDQRSRVVATRFDAFATRFINVELELKSLAPRRARSSPPGRYTLTCASGAAPFITIGFDLTR
jgi:hypothetical protein